jgi:hypothetical protein
MSGSQSGGNFVEVSCRCGYGAQILRVLDIFSALVRFFGMRTR